MKRLPGRRLFLGIWGATVLTVISKVRGQERAQHQGTNLGMVIDLNKCIGCKSCTITCKMEHSVRPGGFRTWVNSEESGRYPKVTRFFLPRLCNHCENAACVRVCPTGASYRDPDYDSVQIDKKRCIGCRACINACRYGSRYFNWYREKTADVARIGGTPDKCTFCAHRVKEGLVPACVNTCVAGARIFGDLNDPESLVAKAVTGNAVQVLYPAFGTKPKVFYLGLRGDMEFHPPTGGR